MSEITKRENGGNKRCSRDGKRAFMWVTVDANARGTIDMLFVYQPGAGWIFEEYGSGSLKADPELTDAEWEKVLNELWDDSIKSAIV